MSKIDLPTSESLALLAIPKECPDAEWRSISQGRIEKWELAVGVITPDPSLRGLMVVMLHAIQSVRPAMQSFHFGLFYREHGATRRVYMIEVDIPPIGSPTSHEWPHKHVGSQRRDNIPLHECPKSFSETLEQFLLDCNISLEEQFSDPFDFQLRP